jgi:hypothetical protein
MDFILSIHARKYKTDKEKNILINLAHNVAGDIAVSLEQG